MNMSTYYFTYGSEGQPFVGGWTEVIAPSLAAACAMFRMFHPDRYEGILNCADTYSESFFRETSMYRNGNRGRRCVERITLQHTLVED